MPYKSKYKSKKSYASKTKNRRYAIVRKKRLGIPRHLIVPDRKLVRLRYVDAVNINPGIGAVATNTYSANGLYDVDITGTGHQPLGFDQWMAFYDHYTVLGSKCIVRFWNGTAASPAIGFINLNDDSTMSTTLSTIAEQPNTKRRALAISGAGGSTQVVLSKGFSAKRFFGNKNPMGDDEQAGSAAANPTEQAYYICGAYPLDHAADLGNISMEVEIQYTVMLHERKDLAQS